MSTSVGHGAYSLGYQTAFDSGKSALTKHNLALAYNAWDMILKNRPKLETGVPASSAVVGFI